jgi:enamine deaminase RidA (YjgF/YER057c/UK114 family)
MEKRLINPSSLPPPRGYNHGILVNGGQLLFLAGQDASDASGKLVGLGDIVAQMEQVLRNLQAVVEEADGSMQDIVKLNIFVRDRADYRAHLKAFGPLFRRYFGQYYPALALFEVAGFFHEEALIELEGIAVIEPGR